MQSPLRGEVQGRAGAAHTSHRIREVWHDLQSLRYYSNTIKRAAAKTNLTNLAGEFDEAIHQIKKGAGKNPHESVERIIASIRDRNLETYKAAFESLTSFANLLKAKELHDLHESLISSFSVRLKNEICDTPNSDLWDYRMQTFDSVSHWLTAFSWLTRRTQANFRRDLESKIEKLKSRERSLLGKLAGDRAWSHCFARMTDTERQALIGWSQAIRKIGKGTGKRAVYARKAAQEYMNGCRSAIPAWIMPLYRVAESIQPTAQSFDVVIVDEASQCGPEALFLAHIAKQIIVVGDDKQISPESVAVEVDQLEALKQRFLKDIPHAFHYGGAESSLFGLADILFSDRIRLREHFRCMPEIIQFSNTLSYANEPLIPLKQFSGGRLSPTVSAKYIPSGHEKGEKSKSNPPEAEAILSYLQESIQDPKYKDKTFGIISLLGHGGGQINLINKLINERIAPKDIEERKIICGDAYSFQGDERDVICISMVVAPGHERSIYAMTKETDRKRLNVSASRAREQMILFHSVTENDLSQNDLRYHFLSYCRNPKLEPIESPTAWLQELKRIASTTKRSRGNQPEPFDSWFEVDVFLRISERGYRIIPQYEIAGRRIDMVIDGPKGRLAVECDGDEWHGPERAMSDFNRQRLLQRCGFQFWRILGSDFYLDQSGSMKSLWDTLDHLGFRQKENSTPSECTKTAAPPAPAFESAQSSSRKEPDVKLPISSVTGDQATRQTTPNPKTEETITSKHSFVSLHITSTATGYPDPRTGKPKDILDALVSLVEVEGPLLVRVLYKRYTKAAGLDRAGQQIRNELKARIYSALRSKRLAHALSPGSNKFEDRIVYVPGKEIRVRTRGDRLLSEIPVTELAELMRHLSLSTTTDKDSIFRNVLEVYGLRRLTNDCERVLNIAYEHFKSVGAKTQTPPPSPVSRDSFTLRDCRNLFAWNAMALAMSNSWETFLLSNVEQYRYALELNKVPADKVIEETRKAFSRAIQLGFDLEEEYVELEVT